MKYKHNYISNVICKFDYVEINLLEIERIELLFWQDINSTLTERKILETTQHQFKFENGVNVTDVKNVPVFEYNNEKFKILFSIENISFECKKYAGFNEFINFTKMIMEKFYRITSIASVQRIGFRYINKIFVPGKLNTLLQYINSNLSSVGKFLLDENDVARQAGQIILNKDDYKIIMVYGFINPDFPATIVKHEFILDFDCIATNIEYSKIESTLGLMHVEITRLFEKSITHKLRNKMEVINND